MPEPAAGRLAGRVALITGGSRGQGAAHAQRLAAEGASVLLADVLDADGLLTEKQLLTAGFDAAYLHLDVSDPTSWQTAYELIDARFGRLDILVNNAGIIHVTPIEDESVVEWNRLLSVNLTGAFLGLHTMIPLLRRGTNPAVVKTSSIFGPSGAIGYAASKAGLLGLTRTRRWSLPATGSGSTRLCRAA